MTPEQSIRKSKCYTLWIDAHQKGFIAPNVSVPEMEEMVDKYNRLSEPNFQSLKQMVNNAPPIYKQLNPDRLVCATKIAIEEALRGHIADSIGAMKLFVDHLCELRWDQFETVKRADLYKRRDPDSGPIFGGFFNKELLSRASALELEVMGFDEKYGQADGHEQPKIGQKSSSAGAMSALGVLGVCGGLLLASTAARYATQKAKKSQPQRSTA